MGQAKQRGTPEQRRAEAEQREVELNRARKEHIDKLEESEKESQKFVDDYIKTLLVSYITREDKLSSRVRERPVSSL